MKPYWRVVQPLTLLPLVLAGAGCAAGQSAVPFQPATFSQSALVHESALYQPPLARVLNGGPQPNNCSYYFNSSNFNGTSIAAGDTVWFTSAFQLQHIFSPVTIYMIYSTISVTSGNNTYVLQTPNSVITVSPSQGQPTLTYDNTHFTWNGTYPANTAGNDLSNAFQWKLSQQLPGGANPVTWKAMFFTSPAGVQFNWQWAAAAYTQFNTSYNALGVKPIYDNHYQPYNSDNVGTPENYKQYVTGGARGGGGSNYTGSWSGTLSVKGCDPN